VKKELNSLKKQYHEVKPCTTHFNACPCRMKWLLEEIAVRDKRIKELEERCASLEAINDKDLMEEPTL